jgi:hypothetical protein
MLENKHEKKARLRLYDSLEEIIGETFISRLSCFLSDSSGNVIGIELQLLASGYCTVE